MPGYSLWIVAVIIIYYSKPASGQVGGWDEWQEWRVQFPCQDPCSGTEFLVRSRDCANGGNCVGLPIETQLKDCSCDGVSGAWGAWTTWGTPVCTKSCGTNLQGTSIRDRQCNNPPPQNGGATCPGSGQDGRLETCPGTYPACPVPGGWGAWTTWGAPVCTKSCGTNLQGTSIRDRQCNNPPPQNGGATCPGSGQDGILDTCPGTYPACPVSAGWGAWTTWGTPVCTKSCGTNLQGTSIRDRQCNNPPPQNGGATCPGSGQDGRQETCPGTYPACPVSAGWGAWTTWGTPVCTKSCGTNLQGTSIRDRQCNNPPPQNGGATCPGSGQDGRLETCPGTYPACPQADGWGSWMDWVTDPCQVSCGDLPLTVFAYRTRTCTQPGSCPGDSYEINNVLCDIKPCGVSGGWGAWTTWGAPVCTKSCGTNLQGTSSKYRQCNNPPPQNGGANCPGSGREDRLEACPGTYPACPVSGGWSAWTTWGAPVCTKSCGTNVKGISSKYRQCNNPPPQNGGATCPGSPKEDRQETCPGTYPACPVTVSGGWGAWTTWGASVCTKSCGTNLQGTSIRDRQCNNPPPQNGGATCPGSGQDDRLETCPGTYPACPVSGGWGAWTRWSATVCMKSCGTNLKGISSRDRLCTNPSPRNNEATCAGSEREIRMTTCPGSYPLCPGGGNVWVVWGAWSKAQCSVSCGAATDTVKRTRTCKGTSCTGDSEETEIRSCYLRDCPVSGGWGTWTKWGAPVCTKSCGINLQGTSSIYRLCNNPSPKNGGATCPGSRQENRLEACPGTYPACPGVELWTAWSEWSHVECPVTCGTKPTKEVERTRTCNGTSCRGKSRETEKLDCTFTICEGVVEELGQTLTGVLIGAGVTLIIIVIIILAVIFCRMKSRSRSKPRENTYSEITPNGAAKYDNQSPGSGEMTFSNPGYNNDEIDHHWK